MEEHFYIFLPILLLVLARFASNREDPFRILPAAWLVSRRSDDFLAHFSVSTGTPNFNMAYAASHERMDSLFFGVLLGYLHHFRPQVIDKLVQPTRNRLIIASVSAAFVSCAFLFPRENKFLATWGYTLIYLGFGGILVLSLYVHGVLPNAIAGIARMAGKGLAYIGMYSYSIYLWHWPCDTWMPGLVRHVVHFPAGDWGRFAIYFPGTLVVGIMMSRLIEYPVLRLRDRVFPAEQGSELPIDGPVEAANALAPNTAS